MGRLVNLTVSGALALGLVMSGCGNSSSTSSTSQTPSTQTPSTPATASTQTSTSAPSAPAPTESTSKEHLAKVTILLSSPVFSEGSAIPAHYTCDGSDVSPPLRWSAVPPNTAELVLFVTNFNGTAPGGGPLVYWAVAGLRPTLKGIAAGALPPGAIVGRNSAGQSRYSICPSKSSGVQHYLLVLFALQHPVSAQPGFGADALFKTVSDTAEYKGFAGFSYHRA